MRISHYFWVGYKGNVAAHQLYTVRHNHRPPSFKLHNLVNIRFIYMNISGNIAEGIPSVHN